jgi:hypothetical protein
MTVLYRLLNEKDTLQEGDECRLGGTWRRATCSIGYLPVLYRRPLEVEESRKLRTTSRRRATKRSSRAA